MGGPSAGQDYSGESDVDEHDNGLEQGEDELATSQSPEAQGTVSQPVGPSRTSGSLVAGSAGDQWSCMFCLDRTAAVLLRQ